MGVMDWVFSSTPPPRNSYVEVLTPHVVVFGDGASKGVVKIKWGHKWANRISVLIRGDTRKFAFFSRLAQEPSKACECIMGHLQVMLKGLTRNSILLW